MNVCKESGLPVQSLRLFSRLTLAEFLKGKVRLQFLCFLDSDFLILDGVVICTILACQVFDPRLNVKLHMWAEIC
mgnify:CR=1 FL=1